MLTQNAEVQNLSDHDLLIRIDERTRDLVDEIRGNGSDGLIRRVSKLEKFMWGLLAVGVFVGWAASLVVR